MTVVRLDKAMRENVGVKLPKLDKSNLVDHDTADEGTAEKVV
jgi:hypothetical protein